MEATFRAVIQEERERGRTVLLSSHILAEVEALCDRVSIIRDGRNVESGTLGELRHLARTTITAELAEPLTTLDGPAVHGLVVDGNRVQFDVDTGALDEVLRRLTEHGVRSLTSQPPTLEELFLRHYTSNGDHESEAGGVAMTGTWALIRLALRRDRLTLPIWIVVLGVLPASMASSYETYYPTAVERAGLTASIGRNPSVAVLYGPAFDLSTAGGFAAWRVGGLLAVLTGLMAIFTVTRHTRAEEDSGRAELLASAAVGRNALLSAGIAVAAGASVLIGAVQALALLAADLPVDGAVALGLATAATGLVFTAVAAVACQFAEYSRSANGIGAAVLGFGFLLRAVGDSSTVAPWLSWLSPIGWAQQLRPFAGERWWVVIVPALAAVMIGAVALRAAASARPRRRAAASPSRSGAGRAELGEPGGPGVATAARRPPRLARRHGGVRRGVRVDRQRHLRPARRQRAGAGGVRAVGRDERPRRRLPRLPGGDLRHDRRPLRRASDVASPRRGDVVARRAAPGHTGRAGAVGGEPPRVGLRRQRGDPAGDRGGDRAHPWPAHRERRRGRRRHARRDGCSGARPRGSSWPSASRCSVWRRS